MSIWFENLPELCPEADATRPNGREFYRLIEGETIACRDFWSHRKIWPTKIFNTCECRAMSVSVFEEAVQCSKLLLLPVHENKKIAAIKLTEDAGLIKRTGKQDGHFSWWRTSGFDPVSNSYLVSDGA